MPKSEVDAQDVATSKRARKRLVVCCDGTWNRLDAPNPTNVVRTAQAVLPQDDHGVQQVVFYDEGVGTGEGRAKTLDRFIGGAFGAGLEKNIEDAYRFLVFNFEDGGPVNDEIFVFGFSRGAYTARSLCGLIRKCGIAHRRNAGKSSQALELYRNRDLGVDADECHRFIAKTGRRAQIAFLGAWDTVGARGLPKKLALSAFFNDRHQFHDVKLSRIVQRACHAVAIDERRSAFPVAPFETKNEEQAKTVEQLWFPGDHGCVGGGKRNGESKGLSDGAFRWMMEQAIAAGLAVDTRALQAPDCCPDPLDGFDARTIKRWWNWRQLAYAALGTADRRAPPGIGVLHESAVVRWRKDPNYRPAPLRGFAAELGREPWAGVRTGPAIGQTSRL